MAAEKAYYQHHERTVLADLNNDLQLREIGINPVNKNLVAYSEVLGTKINIPSLENTAVSFTGNLTAVNSYSTTLTVSGATVLSTTLAVTGASTFSSTLGVTGAATLSSTLAVTGTATVGAGTGSQLIRINGGAGGSKYLEFQSGSVVRWLVLANNDAESGSNAGTNYEVRAYTDAGAQIDNPLTIVRSAGGAITLARPVVMSSTLGVTGTSAFSAASTYSFGGANIELNSTAAATPSILTMVANGAYGGFAKCGTVGTTYLSDGTAGALQLLNISDLPLEFGINGTVRMRITSTATSSLTTTFSAGASTLQSLTVNTSGAIPILTVATSLTASNTELTATLKVTGTVGMGRAPSSDSCVTIGGTVLSGTFQYGLVCSHPFLSTATTGACTAYFQPTTGTNYAYSTITTLWAGAASMFAGSTVATLYGLRVSDVTVGTTANYAIHTGLGQIRFAGSTATTAGGAEVMKFGSSGVTGVYFGSGAPTISAGQGALYLRTDGSSTSTRMYVNTNGSTTWTAVTTAA